MKRLFADESLLLVVDVQEKLVSVMPDAASLIRDIQSLAQIGQLFNIPILATEQYPKGLGHTVAEVRAETTLPILAKLSFSCLGQTDIEQQIQQLRRQSIVICGIESHVCVMQTAFDLIERGYTVFVPVECVRSRFEVDQQLALERIQHAGAILTTVEAIAFEWLRSADQPQFKAVSQLIKHRSSTMP